MTIDFRGWYGLGMSIRRRIPLAWAWLLLGGRAIAAEAPPDSVVASLSTELVSRSAYEDGPLLELVHRAQIASTDADLSLAPALPAGLRLARGPIRVRDLYPLAPPHQSILVAEASGRAIRRVLERSWGTLPDYRPDDRAPRPAPLADSLLDTFGGLVYEIDLTRPAGDRVTLLTRAGRELSPDTVLRVAVAESRLKRWLAEDPTVRALGITGRGLRSALVETVARSGVPGPSPAERAWSVVPDYVASTERPLVDRLVRLRALPVEEIARVYGSQPALRGDLAYWLARAYGWRERKASGAFADVPDSLEPWLDGLLRRRVLGASATGETFAPFAPIRLADALEWIERAARAAGYALESEAERAGFRRSLLTGTSLVGRKPPDETVSRVQLLGMLSNARFPTLRVIETTDLHGALLPRDHGPGRRLGGSAAMAAHVRRLRQGNPEGSLLLDGGDLFQGTLISNANFGRAVVEQMNLMDYAATAIGNHEFDWSVDTLARRVSAMRFAALGANIVDRRSRKRPPWARADTTFVRRGVRVALLGLAYPATPAVTLARQVTRLRFEDDSATAARWVARLPRHRGRPEVVIVVGHIPATQDSGGRIEGDLARLAGGVRGVDLWLGGHSHTRVSGEVAGVPVLVSGSHGETVGACDLVVDPVLGRVVEHDAWLVTTWADEVVPDSAVQALVERWNARVASQASRPVGTNARRLIKTRGGESTIGSLVADVVREATGTDVALQNNGGLRADLPQGPITYGALFEVLPFDNQIVTMDLGGSELRAVLEEGLAEERIVQVSGLRYRFDLGRPVGSRVTALSDSSGRPLDERRSYRVACNDFMAAGGDDLVTLTRGGHRVDTRLCPRELLEAYVREHGTLDYRGDERIAREPNSRPPSRE